jgi:hypothetical protein
MVTFLLFITAFSLIFFGVSKKQTAINIPKQQVAGVSTPELATFENQDQSYIVQYPSNYQALYLPDGVEFTPKESDGKITLQLINNQPNIQIQNSSNNTTQQNLKSTAQIIKDSFKFIEIETASSSASDRFKGIKIDPREF